MRKGRIKAAFGLQTRKRQDENLIMSDKERGAVCKSIRVWDSAFAMQGFRKYRFW